MDNLVDLGRGEEYAEIHAPIGKEVSELYYLISALASVVLEPNSISAASTPANNNLHLPKIPLPEFSGNLLHWPTFKDKFLTLIHQNFSLSAIEKLHYLAGCVQPYRAKPQMSSKQFP